MKHEDKFLVDKSKLYFIYIIHKIQPGFFVVVLLLLLRPIHFFNSIST